MQRVRLGLAAVVTVVWASGYYIAWKNGTQTPTELSALEAMVLGWAFGGTIKDVLKRKGSEDAD